VVGHPFLILTRQARFWNARHADSVVPKPVVLAWFEGWWCGGPVVLSVIVCWAWFPSAPVVPAWLRAGVVCACGQPASVMRQPPNPPFQPTAARPRSLAFWQSV